MVSGAADGGLKTTPHNRHARKKQPAWTDGAKPAAGQITSEVADRHPGERAGRVAENYGCGKTGSPVWAVEAGERGFRKRPPASKIGRPASVGT